MKGRTTTSAAAVAAIVAVAIVINRLKLNASTQMTPLEIELPRPMFIGTEKPIRVSNLRKLDTGARPPFLAPVGTTNVALGKPVSGSEEEPFVGEIEMITDGDKEAADGSYVELAPLAQYVTIDLEAVHKIYAIDKEAFLMIFL